MDTVKGNSLERYSTSTGSVPFDNILTRAAKKGFSGSNSGTPKGFGATSKTKKKPSKKAVLKRIEKLYGGTSGPQIAQATQQRIETAMRQLPPHFQMATQLYQQLQTWDARLSTMTVLQQTTQISPAEMEGAQRAREELQRIYDEHGISEVDLRNTFQKITWDASADAKAARSITGDMPAAIAERVDRACAMVAETVGSNGRCLDVGCGFGVLVPYLTEPRRLQPCQIYGIDLSPEMIRNAQELHGSSSASGPTFEAVDFLKDYQPPPDEDGKGTFEAVMFCSALHDMPDMDATLAKAWSLVKPGGGRLFVLHAQGASHVAQQSRANPVLVPRGLPTAQDYQEAMKTWLEGARLVVAPAQTRDEEEKDGYLAVLEKA
eukprot:scaffold17828_cov168-Amphora_coffeaeformis.AAC.5